MRNLDLRSVLKTFTTRFLTGEKLMLEELTLPELSARFDTADGFSNQVYDDLIEAVATRPVDESLELMWKRDLEYVDVLIDHELLALEFEASTLGALRARVRAHRPMTQDQVVSCVRAALEESA